MKEAISRAIEGGYEDASISPTGVVYPNENRVLLDPLFWQCLGKALGWDAGNYSEDENSYKGEWEKVWHRFINHLAEGKSADEFFNSFKEK